MAGRPLQYVKLRDECVALLRRACDHEGAGDGASALLVLHEARPVSDELREMQMEMSLTARLAP